MKTAKGLVRGSNETAVKLHRKPERSILSKNEDRYFY